MNSPSLILFRLITTVLKCKKINGEQIFSGNDHISHCDIFRKNSSKSLQGR